MNRALRTLLSDIAAGRVTGPRAEEHARTARAILAPKRKLAKAAARKRREAKREERSARRSALRAAAMLRDDGRCILCGYPDSIIGRLHMHHLIGRHVERIDTVAMLCEPEHHKAHRGEVETLKALAARCIQKDMREAAVAISRRLDKVTEARSAR